MSTTNRRSFLRFLGSAALGTALPGSIKRALAVPARRRTGTIEDVEHVVFLMQENRAFDHYFGTLRGVRGFGDLSVFGPNGFLRTFRGSVAPKAKANLEAEALYDPDGLALVRRVTNRGSAPVRVSAANAYGDDSALERDLASGQSLDKRFSLKSSFGWYDIAVEADADPQFLRRLAGHVENGRDSASDPAFGGQRRARSGQD